MVNITIDEYIAEYERRMIEKERQEMLLLEWYRFTSNKDNERGEEDEYNVY